MKLAISPVHSQLNSSRPLEVEKNGDAQSVSYSRGASQDHGVSGLLIDRFIAPREATTAGQEARVKIVEAEIDGLLAEKAEIEKWAAVGSA
jgi:hypothetical protein